MIEKMFICSLLLLVLVIQQQNFGLAQDDTTTLLESYRGFKKFIDDDRLSSYLSSFGHSSPTDVDHEIFKRSPKRKLRKNAKKTSTTTTAAPKKNDDEDDYEIITGKPHVVDRPSAPKQQSQAVKSAREIVPGEVFKFEIDDAVYNEDYEKFRKAKSQSPRKSRHTPSSRSRVKRSPPSNEKEQQKDVTLNERKKKDFMQPKEVFRFLISDAVTPAPVTSTNKESSEKKKRETDQSTADTKNLSLLGPQREQRHVTKHVGYDEMPAKLKSMIDSALSDALARKVANENDYLKFYYGDKIIKVPVSLSKHIKLNKKETTPSKTETPTKTTTSSSSYSSLLPPYKYEKPIYHTTGLPPTTIHHSKGAESYANIKTPIVIGKPIVNEIDLPTEIITEKPTYETSHKKSVYFYSSDDEDLSSPSIAPALLTTSSVGPALFTTPSSIDTKYYKNHVIHPTHTEVKFLKDEIPINEHIDETYSGYQPPPSPLVSLQTHPIHAAPVLHTSTPIVAAPPVHHHHHHHTVAHPVSYVDYMGNHDGYVDKNYEFGYHISDYKTGNSYGHMQQKHEKETKGEYSILLPDGRVQVVKYIANDSGFHADVSYENIHH